MSNAAGLRLLAIGTDPDLARPPAAAIGDAHQRQLKYASILANYQMIVRTVGGVPRVLSASAGFTVHTSASSNRLVFPIDAFRQGMHDLQDYAEQILKVCSGEPALVNTANDFAPRPAYRPQTKFESRGVKLGHGVWDVVFRAQS